MPRDSHTHDTEKQDKQEERQICQGLVPLKRAAHLKHAPSACLPCLPVDLIKKPVLARNLTALSALECHKASACHPNSLFCERCQKPLRKAIVLLRARCLLRALHAICVVVPNEAAQSREGGGGCCGICCVQ